MATAYLDRYCCFIVSSLCFFLAAQTDGTTDDV